jgi:hypothetical protein
VAQVEARINLILSGTSELNKLSSKLSSIEETANSIQDLFNQGVLGRATDLNTYAKSLNEIGKAAASTRAQVSAIADVNAEIKKGILIESQLRRERSRTSRLSRAFETETKGLDQTKGKLKEIKQEFQEISSALKSAFKLGDVKIISQLRNELSALVEDQREWNRALTGTKNIGVNSDLLKEQARNYTQQIEQLRKRALALQENEEIIRRIAAAEYNLVQQRDKATGAFTAFADPRLGREILNGVKSQISAEEQLARERAKNAADYARQQEATRNEIFKTIKAVGGIAKKAGGATFDAITFGKGAEISRGARNAAIRGGLGLGALGIGGAYATTQEALGSVNLGILQGPAETAAKAIGGALNGAFGGVPAIINDMLSALGNVPSSLGLASVAALAFAPAMKTAADAVFLAGKKFGETKFGENIKLTLDRQTNLFESVINKATEMNMVLDASRSGLDAVGRKVQTIPTLPAAGQTAFAGEMRRGRSGAFIGGGAREIKNPEFLATAAGTMAQRTQEAASVSLLFAEGLGRAADEAKTIAEYLREANNLRSAGESSTQRFIRKAVERGRLINEDRSSANLARFRSARALAEEAGTPMFGTPLALPAAGQTSFKGEIRQAGEAAGERGGMFLGGGAREAIKNAEFLTNISGRIAARTKDAAEQTYRYAQGLKQASVEAAGLSSELEKSGLEEALQLLKDTRNTRQDFLGKASPAEAIDKIVREFNTGKPVAGDAAKNITETFNTNLSKGASRGAAAAKSFAEAAAQAIKDVFGIASPSRFMIELVRNLVATYIAEMQKSYPRIQAATERAFGEEQLVRGVKTLAATNKGFEFTDRPSTGFRPLKSIPFNGGVSTPGATSEFGNMMLQFRKDIAELTTQPEIYSNLLTALPDFAITTDLAGAASRRAFAAEIPSFMSAQRQLGPGELEKEIASAAAKYFRTVRTPDPWVGLVGDYKGFIDKIIAATQKLNQGQLALPGSRVAGALPPASQNLTAAQEQRIQEAYRRSEARGLSVLAQDAFSASGRPALSAVNFGFMADSARISRLSGIGRALPPAIDVAGSEVENQSRSLRQSVSDLFDRISSGIRSSFGGGGAGFGGGRFGGVSGGAGDFGDRLERAISSGPEALLGLEELARPATASIRELEALSTVLKEFRSILDPTVEGFDRLDRQLRETAANLDRQLERRAPDADFLTRQFGSRGGRAVSEGLIGGAFPLLFGQGLGASVLGGLGGAAGGFAGGGLGFGLSLVGTALGTAFDTAVQSATELGNALNDSAQTFDKVKERALFSSKETEKFANKLQEAGFAASAATISQQEIINKIGRTGVRSLQQLSDSSDRLNRAWAEFSLQLQAALAGPMAGLLEWVSEVLDLANQESRSRAVVADIGAGLSGAKKQEFEQKRFDIESRRGGIAASVLRDLGIGNFLSDEEANKLRAQLVNEFKDFSVPVKLKPASDATQEAQQELAALTKQLEVIDIGKSLKDQYRQAAREQKDLDKQRADLVRSYEESISDIRKGVEDKILQQRRQNAQTEIDIRSKAADLQLEKLKQANNEFRGLFSDTLAGETANRLLDAVETVTGIQNQSATERANLELQTQNTIIDTEKYKLDVANQVSKLNQETARRVADINEQVRRRNEDFDNNRFKLEKRIAEIRLIDEQAKFKGQLEALKKALSQAQKAGEEDAASGLQNSIDVYTAQLAVIEQAQKDIEKISAPSALRGVGQVGGGGVSISGIDEAANAGIRLQQSLQAVKDQIAQVNSAGALLGITAPLEKQIQQTNLLFDAYKNGGGQKSRDLAAEALLIEAINQKLGEQKDQTSDLSRALSELLVKENGRTRISVLLNKAASARTQEKQLDNLINKEAELRAQIDLVRSGKEEMSLVDEARLLFAREGVDLEDEKTKLILKQLKVLDQLNQEYKTLTAEQQMQQELFDGMAGAVASTFGSAIDAAVRGTENLGEALKNLGGDLLATIAKMLIMYTIGQALGALGGNDKVGVFSTLAKAFGYKAAAKGAYFADGVAAFANGGMFTNSIVSSPTLFQFADGGAMRTGLMGEAGPEAIMPLRRGPDGRLGVEASVFDAPRNAMQASEAFASSSSSAAQAMTMSEASTSSGSSIGGPITIQTQVINNVEYATVDQVKEASEISVKRARSQVFADLKNRPASRQSAGIK